MNRPASQEEQTVAELQVEQPRSTDPQVTQAVPLIA